jgi:two-component system, NtrC family, sensor histidine kinase PilS
MPFQIPDRRRTNAPPDRRAGDRRQADRRRASANRRAPDESWFGALGVGADTRPYDDSGLGDAEQQFSRGWPQSVDASDGRFLARQARRLVSAGESAFPRIYRAFVAARATVGVALLAAQVVASGFGIREPLPPLLISLAYAAQALTVWLLPRFRAPDGPDAPARMTRMRWLATIGVDVLAFFTLQLFEPGSSFNYGALLIMPVLMGGVLTSRLAALATVAAVALAMLVVAWFATMAGADMVATMAQAGLAGIGLFVITLLAGELAGRLAREELTARGSLDLARQQAQLNRLVIDEMADGVLVIDRTGRVRSANPAARRLLALAGEVPAAPFELQSVPAWITLEAAVERAFREAAWPEEGRDVPLQFGAGLERTLRVRVRFTRRRRTASDKPDAQPPEEFCVLFVEDLRSVHARTRQEKLAAMGRVSAGIAHEIRNPLAAIAQANALMQEGTLAEDQQRLARMVASNVERLKRVVDDVMDVAPGTAPSPQVIDAAADVAALGAEWARSAGIAAGDTSRLRVELPSDALGVLFDHDHLRRVLVNLLDNAGRHASAASSAIVLRLVRHDATTVQLSVASDGPPIAPDVERHLFEPFFSTRSRGTGLGLYICRELCERYGGRIEYRLRPPEDANRNEFVVLMRASASEAVLPR